MCNISDDELDNDLKDAWTDVGTKKSLGAPKEQRNFHAAEEESRRRMRSSYTNGCSLLSLHEDTTCSSREVGRSWFMKRVADSG